MTAFIMKMTDNTYDLISTGLTSQLGFNVLATLFQKDFDLMIEFMEQMRESNHLPFYYFFPRYTTVPEIDVGLVRRNEKEYQLILNLGAHILSDMSSDEFDVALYECKEIRSLIPGSKVYFPPVKDIFKNDK